MHLVWHATPAQNALSIRRHGLLARDPAEHNYPHIENERGVYCTDEDPYRQVTHWDSDMRPVEKGNVLVLFDLDPCDYSEDRIMGCGFYVVHHNIPAERILGISPATVPLNDRDHICKALDAGENWAELLHNSKLKVARWTQAQITAHDGWHYHYGSEYWKC